MSPDNVAVYMHILKNMPLEKIQSESKSLHDHSWLCQLQYGAEMLLEEIFLGIPG